MLCSDQDGFFAWLPFCGSCEVPIVLELAVVSGQLCLAERLPKGEPPVGSKEEELLVNCKA